MPLSVLPCNTSDIEHAVRVEQKAFDKDPFNPIFFPGPFPEDGKKARIDNFIKDMQEDPTVRWVKVVDTDSPNPSEGIAYALWQMYFDKKLDVGPPGPFSVGCNVELCEVYFGELADIRRKIVGGTNCACERPIP